MRITGIRVDGYGVLSGVEIDDLPPGLSVIAGPNEAGKTTLLDFVRGVLFGFPDRRRRQPLHEPLHGGRHGGALRITDDAGRGYVLERHADQRAPSISAADGTPLDEGALRAILGGADDAVFRNVFAFGLDELATFDSLDADEVRELVFSAGVLGAGRSATRATRALDQRRGQLVRPRQHDARANQLREHLDELDQQLRSARRAAEEFPTARRARDVLADEVAGLRRQAEMLHRRQRELERLAGFWPTWRQRNEDVAHLGELGDSEEADLALERAGGEIRRLVAELSGEREREAKRESLGRQLTGIEDDLVAHAATLGRRADDEAATVAIETTDRSRALAEEARALQASLADLDAQHERATSERDAARRELDRRSGGASVRSADELRSAGHTLIELRGLVAEATRARADELAAARAHSDQRGGAGALGPLTVLVVATLGAVALVATTARHSAGVLAAAAALALGCCGALAWALWTRRHRSTRLSATRDPSSEARDARIAELAASLGVDALVSAAALDALEQRLHEERERRGDIDDAARRVGAPSERLDELDARKREMTTRRSTIAGDVAAVAASLGLSPTLSPDGLVAAIETLDVIAELQAARRRVGEGLSILEGSARAYESAVGSLAESVGLRQRDAAVGDLLTELATALGHAEASLLRRRSITEAVARAEENLDEALGSGDDAARLRDELATGTLLAWESEQLDLMSGLGTLDDALEAATKELHDADLRLDSLQRSDEIATLELEREATAAALGQALREWMVLGLARSMVDEALARYERERQPKVIETAAALFADVTEGRYVALVAREDPDGQRRRGIDVIAATGSRVAASDLSRGTAEQLYLCLRLAFATTFAERSVALPLVLDDVLVNFDPPRALAVAQAVAATATRHQVIAFTCHPHVIECFANTGPIRVVDLARS